MNTLVKLRRGILNIRHYLFFCLFEETTIKNYRDDQCPKTVIWLNELPIITMQTTSIAKALLEWVPQVLGTHNTLISYLLVPMNF